MVTGPDNKRNGDIYNMNGTFFLEDLLLSLKYEMIGFLIPIVSRSASLREENFLPVSPFLCKWFTILSSTPIWRKKVIISSVLKDDKFPSFGIVISFSGINLETAENKDMHVFITTGMLVYQTMNTDLNQNSSRCVGNFQYLMKGVKKIYMVNLNGFVLIFYTTVLTLQSSIIYLKTFPYITLSLSF